MDVAVRARNAALLEGAGRRLVVAANDRAEVRFPAAAARAGTALFQVGAASGIRRRRRRARAAGVDAGHDRGLRHLRADRRGGDRPAGDGPGRRRARVRRPRGHDLLDRAPGPDRRRPLPRGLPVRVRRAALLAGPGGRRAARRARRLRGRGPPAARRAREAVARDIERLRALQNGDGGFGFWRRGDRSWPYVSIHAAHALVRAQEKGFAVPEATLARSRAYLRDDRASAFPSDYADEVRRTLVAYALHVQDLMGDPRPAAGPSARATRRARRGCPSRRWAGSSRPCRGTPARRPSRDASADASPTASPRPAAAAHFAVSYARRRAPAPPLESPRRRGRARGPRRRPAGKRPRSRSSWPASSRTAGRGAGRTPRRTSSSSSPSTATSRPTRRTTPDFVARAWLGERYAGEHAFRGHTDREPPRADPHARPARGRTRHDDLLLAKDGPGRLYYRIGLRYAPEGLRLEPLDRGFTVERTYEAVDDDGRRPSRPRRHLAHPRRRPRPGAAHDGGPHPALPRRARRPAPGGPRGGEPGPRHHRHAPRRRGRRGHAVRRARPGRSRVPRPLVVVEPAVVRAPEPARRAGRGLLVARSGRVSTPTATSPAPRPPAPSWSPRRRPRRCTPPRPSAAAATDIVVVE